MAIYHFSAQVISRGKGQSAVAAAAYRSGEELVDGRTGELKFYSRDVEPEAMILAPEHSPDWIQDRNRLWNEVEKAEKRKDAQLAREINVALPKELNQGQQRELIRDFVQKEFVEKGMIADIAIHRDDENNPHAHVMLTTREITPEGFGGKNRDWNDRKLLEQWRAEWANRTNLELERAGSHERISHLSHAARGLEQQPTVHLGHVAHDMEKRGIQTDRGNLNRERQEYNQLVVDLQKYREEKQAIKQKMAQEQERKQMADRFLGPAERTDLKAAASILKVDPSLKNIAERQGQLDKWENRVANGEQYLRWKDEKVKEASDHFKRILYSENRIKEAQQQLENINWLNPMKVKENRLSKEAAERAIVHAKEDIKTFDEKLNYHREKIGFTTEKEFTQLKTQHEAERPGLMEKNQNSRQHIRYEREVLQKAETALQNAVVRELASKYPNHPEMQHMGYKEAQNLNRLNAHNGKIIPIESIEKTVNSRKQTIQKLQGELDRYERNRSRLSRAEDYLKKYEESKAVVDKYESNPLVKGKVFVSKSAKQEYNQAVSNRDKYLELMKGEGVSGRTDFEAQQANMGSMDAKIPAIKENVKTQEVGLELMDNILKGFEQAGRDMERERKRQEQKVKGRGQGKERTRGR
jgi:hypothetical protein